LPSLRTLTNVLVSSVNMVY